MHRLLVVFISFVVSTNAGLLRVPKIYNALISSDENLSPSHTYPVVEPVFRTTALGVAFPPLLASPPYRKDVLVQTEESKDKKVEMISKSETIETDTKVENPPKKSDNVYPQLSYHGTLFPVTYDPYLPFTYPNDFLFPALPYYEQPVLLDVNQYKGNNQQIIKEKEQINPAVNFKKNPDIPDVPPPPLPVKVDKNNKP